MACAAWFAEDGAREADSVRFWRSRMWHEMNKSQKLGFIVSTPILLLLAVASIPLGLRHLIERDITVDALAGWVFGIMVALYLDRYFVSRLDNRFARVLLTLSVIIVVGQASNEMQTGAIPFVGFPNKWAFIIAAIFLVGTELLNDPAPRKARRRKRRRRR